MTDDTMDRAARVLRRMADADWDVDVWPADGTIGHQEGNVDPSDRRRLVEAVLGIHDRLTTALEVQPEVGHRRTYGVPWPADCHVMAEGLAVSLCAWTGHHGERAVTYVGPRSDHPVVCAPFTEGAAEGLALVGYDADTGPVILSEQVWTNVVPWY